MEFDPEQHEKEVAERFARLAKYDAFDRLIDLALIGQVTLEDAIQAFREEYVEVIES